MAADVMLHHNHTIATHDAQYVATLTVAASKPQLSFSLHSPHTGHTYANTFTADYIVALTRKAQHPLSFTAFVTLLSSALSAANTATDDTAANSTATLDVLSASDVHSIRARLQPLSSTASSTEDREYKLYLVVTVPLTVARQVHFPLPLPNITASHQPQQKQQPSELSLSVPAAAPSALSVLTATIAQLSVALKEARREARQERNSRRQREEQDKQERDSMRAEISWLKEKVSEHERDSHRNGHIAAGGQQQPSRASARDVSVEALRAKLQREERQRKETEVLLAMWRTRCERAEAESTRLRLARGDISTGARSRSSSRGGSSTSRVGGSQARTRGRSRERPTQLPSQRGVSSRSVSPSYMQPTSSTAAKNHYFPLSASLPPSPRSSYGLSSAVLSRAASPRSLSNKQQRSTTPPPLAPYPSAAHPGSRSQRATSPSASSLSVARRSPLSRTTSPNSPRPLSPALNSHSTADVHHSHTRPHHQQTMHSRSLSDKTAGRQHSREREHRPNGMAHPTALQSSGKQPSNHNEQQQESSASSATSPAALSDVSAESVLPDVRIAASDVHSRLSALQRFLREEKSKAWRRNV